MIRGTSCCKFLGWAFTAQQLRGAQHLWHCLFFFNCVMNMTWETVVDSSYSNILSWYSKF